MGKFLGDTFIGAALGFCASLIACWIVGCKEIASCFMSCLCGTLCGGSGLTCSDVIAEPKIMNCLIYITIIGAVIGCIYGIYEWKMDSDEMKRIAQEESSEAARKQRIHWADQIKQKALTVENTCNRNNEDVSPLVSTTYKSGEQMDSIMNELTKVAELQGKVDSISDELHKKGGVQ